MTPYLCGDDYIFQMKIPADGIFGTERIHSLSDLIESQINFYNNYHYRIINHTVLQVLLLLPPIVFDLLNTIVFLLLPYVLLLINPSTNPNIRGIRYLTILSFIWVFHFSLGWSYFPATGALNYTWMLIPQILYIVLLLRHREKAVQSWKLISLAMINIMANENVCVTLLLLTLFVLLETRRRKDYALYSCIAIIVLGGIIMLSSPSISNRLSEQGFRDSTISSHIAEYIKRLVYYTIRYSPILLILMFISIKRLTFGRMQLYLIITIIVANGIMIIVPLFEARSAVYGFFIAMLLILSSLPKDFYSKKLFYLLIVLASLVTIVRAPHFITLNKSHKLNTELLEANRGAESIELMPYCDKGLSDYVLCHDISSDPNYFDNQSLSSFYDIDNVILNKSQNIEILSKGVFHLIKQQQRVPDHYKLIHSGNDQQIYFHRSNEKTDLIIESVDMEEDFYIIRGLKKSIANISLLSMLPKSIAISFADYLEDSTLKQQPNLIYNGRSYNYYHINNSDVYNSFLIAPYSIENHSVSGDIIKCNLLSH